jgi:hypothetical protein
MSREEDKQAQEDKAALSALSVLIKNPDARIVIKYILKSLEVGTLPPQGLSGEILHDYLGFLRAGKSIWEMVSQADHVVAGLILAEIQKEKHDEFIKQNL